MKYHGNPFTTVAAILHADKHTHTHTHTRVDRITSEAQAVCLQTAERERESKGV